MRKAFVMFVTAVCFLVLLKLKWPKNKLLLVLLTVTSEDVSRNIRNVKLKLNNFVFQHAFYCHVCNCSLCAISH